MKQSSIIACLTVLGLCLLIGLPEAAAWGGREMCFAGHPDESRIDEMIEHLATELSLSPEQAEEIRNLHLEHFDSMAALRELHDGDRDAMREAHRALRTELDERVKSLLSEEQATAYDDHVQELRRRHGRHGHGRGPR